MAFYDTAATIINDAATEVGLVAVTDPFASSDAAFVQLRNMLTSIGRELLGLYQWQKLISTYSFNTTTNKIPATTNEYDLPADFDYMIDQTYWSPSTTFPLGGPLSPQDWQYLVNTNLAPSVMYVSFRMVNSRIILLPNPPPANQNINFQYMSRYWAAAASSTIGTLDRITASDQVVLYNPILAVKFLKLRFLEAKGFDTTAALGQFNSVFMQLTGRDSTAPILALAKTRLFPYLGYRNIPQTNYGLP